MEMEAPSTSQTEESSLSKEEQRRRKTLQKKLSTLPLPQSTIESALAQQNLQDALNWIFEFGELGDMNPSSTFQVSPTASEVKTEEKSTPSSSPQSHTSTLTPPLQPLSKPKTEPEKSALSKKILDMIDAGYDPEDLVEVLPGAKLKEEDSTQTPAVSGADDSNKAPDFDVSTPEGAAALQAFLEAQKAKSGGSLKVTVGGEGESTTLADSVAAETISPEDAAAIQSLLGADGVDDKPQSKMTEEEKRAKARQLQELARKKIAEQEKRDELERERKRIEMGKQITSEKGKYEQIQLKIQREERLRQKRFEQQELARVRAQIAADKERRRKEAEERKARRAT